LGHALACNDVHAITVATRQLAGLGPGLTPSGDDFLAGVMIGDRMANGGRRMAEGTLLFTVAAPRTTRLSRAFLHAASQGYVDERWSMLLTALCGADPIALAQAAQAVFDFGASSGLDMATGFLWQMGQVDQITDFTQGRKRPLTFDFGLSTSNLQSFSQEARCDHTGTY